MNCFARSSELEVATARTTFGCWPFRIMACTKSLEIIPQPALKTINFENQLTQFSPNKQN
jgi:hypothetical protein